MTLQEVIYSDWYAKPNDEIGGWCVMPVDSTPIASGVHAIGDFMTAEIATHVAATHNFWLQEMKDLGAIV